MNMAGKSEEYSLEESDLFKKQVSNLCEVLRIESAKIEAILDGVRWGLVTNPKVRGVVPGTNILRVFKTRRIGNIPQLRVWFVVNDETRSVLIKSVDAADLYL